MKDRFAHLVLIFAVSLAVYANTFVNTFVMDDDLFIVTNKEIHNVEGIPALFGKGTQSLYRPLRMALYAVTYHFSGNFPIGYHIVGKTLNALTVCVLYLVIAELFGNARAAFWGTLIFALHPVHTEKVAFITSTYDIPGDLLWLSAFLCYVVFRRNGRWGYYAASLALFAGGLLGAETAAVLPLVVILYDMTLGAKGRRPALWGVYFLVFGAYFAWRTHVLGMVARVGDSAFNPDPLGNYLTISGVFLEYFRLLIAPVNLMVSYDVVQAVPPYPVHLIAAGLAMAAIAAGVVLLARKRPDIAFAVLWFFVVISPNTNFIPTGSLIAERYLYLPSASLSFLAAIGYIGVGERGRKALMAALVAVAMVFAVQTARRNRDWRQESAIWASLVRSNPTSYFGRMSIASLLKKAGKMRAAERLLLGAMEFRPDPGFAQFALGEIYFEEGRLDEAERMYWSLNANREFKYKSMVNISVILINQGKFAEAEKVLATLAANFPHATLVWKNYAVVLYELKRDRWWIPFMRIYRITGEVEPIGNIARGFELAGNHGMAVRFARIGLAIAPRNKRLREIVPGAGGEEIAPPQAAIWHNER